jgi:hypothetical protein
MTAAIQDRNTPIREGKAHTLPVVANDCIFGGTLTAVNAAGYLNPGSDTAGLIFAGVADDRADNTGGGAGDISATVRRRGMYLFNLGTAITVANVGDAVFLVDDVTVDLIGNVSNGIFCGVIAEYHSANLAWIDVEPAIIQADVATHIADTTGAHAASAVSLADAAGLTAQTTVEAVIAEILPKAAVAIADPGDGGAIPVTRSGTVAITTTGVDDTRTLAIPGKAGIKLAISLDVDGGDAVITVAAAINQTGNNTITMGDAGDTVVLAAVQVGGALVWRLIVNDGAALTTVG